MAVNSLSPGFYKVDYHSTYSPHEMILPTREIDVPSLEFLAWDDITVPAVDTMVVELVDTFLPFLPATVVFDRWSYFYQPTPADFPLIIAANTFSSKVGTDATPGWSKATQLTISALGTGGSKARIVLLDSSTDSNFDPVLTIEPDDDIDTLMNTWGAITNAWATRGGERPDFFLGAFKTLNEKLRRAYHML